MGRYKVTGARKMGAMSRIGPGVLLKYLNVHRTLIAKTEFFADETYSITNISIAVIERMSPTTLQKDVTAK